MGMVTIKLIFMIRQVNLFRPSFIALNAGYATNNNTEVTADIAVNIENAMK